MICSGQKKTKYPGSESLRETGPAQRRDLSIPGSRLVINYYDFHSKLTPVEYSGGGDIPLNVAYLSTKKNAVKPGTATRFGRAIRGILTTKLKTASGSMTANAVETEWMPYSLPFRAKYANGDSITGLDYFYDETTLIRRISSSTGLTLSGHSAGHVETDGSNVFVTNSNINYLITLGNSRARIHVTDSTWQIDLEPSTSPTIIALYFGGDSSEVRKGLKKAIAATEPENARKALQKRKLFWDEFLKKVPHPGNFSLTAVDPKGVQATDVRNAYYKAWIFTAQNLLTEDQINFPYPQVCTGKASLWDEGEERAPFSAAWESFLGIQFYAFIDKDVAWKAFKGMMSLVDSSGMLGGESLPSRKAQTALLLYNLSNDKQSLADVYEALKRYLLWRMRITHWVYGELKPDENNKDAEFVFSALIDMQHMQTICSVLNMEGEKRFWQAKHDSLYQLSLKWFWNTPGNSPVQVYHLGTGEYSRGHTVWVTTGLYVKPGISGRYLESMMKRLTGEFDADKNFGGFSIPKYPDLSYTVYGLIDHGQPQLACKVIQANIRDIVRANASFAEQYLGESLRPDGVRPSLFGSSVLIDFCMLMNGYKYDTGNPSIVTLPLQQRGVSNIPYKNKVYSIIPTNGNLKLSLIK